MKTLIFSMMILCCLTPLSSAIAQKKKSPNRLATITSNDVRIVKKKPHIFISYEHEGKISALYVGESDNRVWLRFHNNSMWQVMFCSGLIPKGYKGYGETEIAYEIERFEGNGEVPGTRSSDSCQYLLLDSGKSIIFSVPREHLADGLAIKVEFRYEWEIDPDGSDNLLEPKHYSFFYSSDIPRK